MLAKIIGHLVWSRCAHLGQGRGHWAPAQPGACCALCAAAPCTLRATRAPSAAPSLPACWLICIEPHDQHRRNPAPRESNPLHPRRNFRESRVKLGNDFSRFHSLTSRYELTEPHDHSFVFLQTFFCSRVPDKSVCVRALFCSKKPFLDARSLSRSTTQGGVFCVRHPGLENIKSLQKHKRWS